jgi:hypothetical protein
MDCYKVLSPSLEELFAIRSLRSFLSVSGPTLIMHLISNWRENAGQNGLRLSFHLPLNVN